MISGDLVYSNDACSAFLTAIVQSFENLHPKGYLGRTAVQKLAYFAQALGVPIPCSFDIYTYGPYSDIVTFSMESLLADEVVVDRSPKPEYSDYHPARNAAHLLRAFQGDLSPHSEIIDRVVKALGGFKPQELELIATLHFIARRRRQVFRRAPSKADIITEFIGVKGDKFKYEEIAQWFDALSDAGLI
jgi:uncharacterized protein YwgA